MAWWPWSDPFRFVANREVRVIEQPFRHFVIDGFFKEGFYGDLCACLRELKAKGFAASFEKDRLSPFSKYDAWFWVPPPKPGHPLDFFYTAEWDAFLAGAFGLPSTRDTIMDFHVHKAGGADGWIHNDFNLCSFKEQRLANGVNPWYHQVPYASDKGRPAPGVFRRMRTIAAMVYLDNKADWTEADGGGTGIYSGPRPEDLAATIAPLDNRVFAFEISPRSFHRFLSNKTFERNTLNQWLHEEPSGMLARHGAAGPEAWP